MLLSCGKPFFGCSVANPETRRVYARRIRRKVADMPYNHRGRELRNNRVEARLSDAEVEQLNEMCSRLDRPASAIVRIALNELAARQDGANVASTESSKRAMEDR
jgi:hypothetical protein